VFSFYASARGLQIGDGVAVIAVTSVAANRSTILAKTLLLEGDLLACVLGGVYTDVEKTLIEVELFMLRPATH
jgi:hypothetical protein